jgi:transposase
MDNTTFHKRQDIQDAITQAGHSLVYLPPYSPDLNPIEKNGRKLKLFVVKKDVLLMSFLNSSFNNHFIDG